MKKLLLILALGLAFNSCNKRDCERFEYGSVIVTNYTNNPIQFYFDGVYLYDLQSLVTETLEIDAGTHQIGGKLEGSGHLDTLWWDEKIKVDMCKKLVFDFE